jgi:hypothetical protein
MKMNTFVTRIPATDICAMIDRRRCDYTKATQKCNIFVYTNGTRGVFMHIIYDLSENFSQDLRVYIM